MGPGFGKGRVDFKNSLAGLGAFQTQRSMDLVNLRHRTHDRRAAEPSHPPRPHPGDERPQLPPQAQPGERCVPFPRRRIDRPGNRSGFPARSAATVVWVTSSLNNWRGHLRWPMTTSGTLSLRPSCNCSAIPSSLTVKRKCPHEGACDIDAERADKASGS